MIRRLLQLENIGRFGGWDAGAARTEDVRLRRLSLVYGGNASGKSTLARVLTAAGRGAVTDLERDRTLDAAGAQRVTIDTDDRAARFDGTAWSGPQPKVSTFDREFVDKNVYVGRHMGKDQRRELLRLALGADDVRLAHALDDLNQRSRTVQQVRREHDAALEAAARACGLPRPAFLALPRPADPVAERAAAEARLQSATVADTLGRMPRPEPLPPPPSVDLATLTQLFATETRALSADVAARVEAHLAGRLHGKGSAWVRDGLGHAPQFGADPASGAASATCPFCAQAVGPTSLVALYTAFFDRSYDELVARIVAMQARVAALETWWQDVGRVGRANVRVFESWAAHVDAIRPGLDSAERGRQLRDVVRVLGEALDAKRREPGRASEPIGLAPAMQALAAIAAAVAAYNDGITAAGALIDARLRELRGVTVADARQALARLEAAIQRHQPAIGVHVDALARLEAQHAEIAGDKAALAARLGEQSSARLAAFAHRINELLRVLGADFTIDAPGSERTGGAAGARLQLHVERGTLEVASSRGEERLARVLSEGDRSTLALAVFLYALEQEPDLAERTVVFDDPMTSQDHRRAQATAEQIAALVSRAAQVIVLSHQPAFLASVGREHQSRLTAGGPQVIELQLDAARRALVPWSAATHVESGLAHPGPLAEGSAPVHVRGN